MVVTRNHLVQKLSSTLHTDDSDVRSIISKLDVATKLKYFHFLKSDLKNPFLAQLTTPIPSTLLPNTQCVVPSLSGKMPNLNASSSAQQQTVNPMNAIGPPLGADDQKGEGPADGNMDPNQPQIGGQEQDIDRPAIIERG